MASIVTLTPAQIADLEEMVDILTETNVGLTASLSNLTTLQGELQDKDQAIRAIHEAIETSAILPLEEERRQLAVPGTTVGSPIGEATLVSCVTNYAPPLFPVNPPSATPILPVADVNLFGGSGTYAGNEEAQISIELAQFPLIVAAGPSVSPYFARFAAAETTIMLSAIAAQQSALASQSASLSAFLASNPVPNEYVTAGDISDATAALAAVTARSFANATYASLVTTFPHVGLDDSYIDVGGTRISDSTSRALFITGTRIPQLTTPVTGTLVRYWDARFTWITVRARMDTGTLSQYASTGQAISNTNTQIASNSATISEINTVLAAQ